MRAGVTQEQVAERLYLSQAEVAGRENLDRRGAERAIENVRRMHVHGLAGRPPEMATNVLLTQDEADIEAYATETRFDGPAPF
jgi:transcriptional regulator with XRE-family HTH domain